MTDFLSSLPPDDPRFRAPNDHRPVEGVRDWRHFLAELSGRPGQSKAEREEQRRQQDLAYQQKLDELPTTMPDKLVDRIHWHHLAVQKYFRESDPVKQAQIKADYGIKFVNPFAVKNDETS